jgi:drug/metabolite transporter (DMT)-like permease
MAGSAALSFKVKLALTISVVLWASAFVAIRAALTEFSPGGLAFFRYLVAAICMWIIYFFLPNKNTIAREDKIKMILVGAVTLGAYHVFLNYGELTVSAGLSSFIISQSPVLTTAFAIVFLQERLNRWGVMGLLVSTFGMLLILLGQEHDYHADIGMIYVLLSAIVGSVYNVMQKPFLKKYNAIEVTSYGIWGSLLTFVFFLPELTQELASASFGMIMTALYLGLFPAALATITWTYALAAMPAARATNFLYFMPVIATALGWFFLGEIVPWVSFAGGLLALTGVWLVNHSYHYEVNIAVVAEE